MGLKERMKQFLKTIPNSKGKIGMAEGEFEKKTGLSNGAISGWGDGLTTKTLQKITTNYPELNPIWLLHGHGEMLVQGSLKQSTTISNQVNEADIELTKTYKLKRAYVETFTTVN